MRTISSLSQPSAAAGGGGGGGGGGSSGGRVVPFLASIPLVTRTFIGLCLVIFFYTPMLYEDELMQWAVCPARVTQQHQWYRMVTSALVHGGYLHIFFNLFAFYGLSKRAEQQLGSLPYFGLILQFIVVGGLLYLVVAEVLVKVWSPRFQYECAVGFSGVIFSVMMIDVALNPGPRSIFGMCAIPAKFYPWLMLVILSAAIQGVSFIGHLAGILVGFLYTKGFLNFMCLPQPWIHAIEELSWLQWLANSSIYVRAPAQDTFASPEIYNRISESCNLAWCGNACRDLCGAISGSASAAAGRLSERADDRRLRSLQANNAYEPVAEEEPDSSAPDADVFDHELDVIESGVPSRAPSVRSSSGSLPPASPASASASASSRSPTSRAPKRSSSASPSVNTQRSGVRANTRGKGGRAPPPERTRAHHQSRLLAKMAQAKSTNGGSNNGAQ